MSASSPHSVPPYSSLTEEARAWVTSSFAKQGGGYTSDLIKRLVEQLEAAEIHVRDITALNSSLSEATAGWKIRAEELQEQFDSALAALREIAYPETRERKDAGIVLARQALKRLDSSPAKERP